ncbi:ferritin-like domain-containing protein [Calycomorphotria hydatis]|uniref:DUF455 domain-containing protein n=1 Tax=Calycomorphotria hydatis TaxID=2528027 RepID=A0A517T992_9PLAN|nr:DUF455 family protein [Calycomorphotria hydatis]QDT64955.1 hypothetical protein V22_22010 [Calycomorphotria hydatis]
MELRAFAEQVLLSEELEQKLQSVDFDQLTDQKPGEALRLTEPTRPATLQFAAPRTAPSMPKGHALGDPGRRAVAHHIMANHELQALEVMAFVLLAFPDAPTDFRLGLARVMGDEQKHTRMHAKRAEELGTAFGSMPVNCYIWKKAQSYTCVLDYLAGLPLVFEGRNLDHTLEFERYFLDAKDKKSAGIMRSIHRDEIEHVAFGLEWLRKLKPADQSEWDTFCAHLSYPLRPDKSVGDEFHIGPRQQAGMSEEFIENLSRLANE